MNLDKDVFQRWSPVISFCYVPFHDELFLGDLLPNGIVDGFYAGVAGAAVSFVANKVYNWVQEKKQFSKLLTFKENQSWINTGIQLSARLIVHVATGAVMGLALGLLVTSAEATAATGCAVGFAAFVGPQLLRLMYQVTAFVFSKIWTSFVAGIEWLLDSPVVQEMALESSISSDKENAKTEVNLYKAMGLETAANSVGLKKLYEYNSTGYKELVVSSISTEVYFHQYNKKYFIYNDCKHDKEICGRLFDAVEKAAEEIRDYRLEHKYVNPSLVSRLAWQLSYAIMNDEPSYVKNFEFKEGMFDPFNFNNPIKISRSEAQLINSIYNKVRRFVKDKPIVKENKPIIENKSFLKSLFNPLDTMKIMYNATSEKHIWDGLMIGAHLWLSTEKNIEEFEGERLIALRSIVENKMQLAFLGKNREYIQDLDVNSEYNFKYNDKVINSEQKDILYINEKLECLRDLFDKKEGLFKKTLEINEWIYSKHDNLPSGTIHLFVVNYLVDLIPRVISYTEFDVEGFRKMLLEASIKNPELKNVILYGLDNLQPIKYPFQVEGSENKHDCTQEEVKFINEVFLHVTKELTK